ncbi:MAG TPA: helix-turn-helix domain-containing protein [Mucilaginibacter sp.]|jgi:hypothetical protein|nr:helix-turn-helix domain-containing protein [Mucilaginibacter sp.]
MAAEIITKEDLLQFEERLTSTIKSLLSGKGEPTPKWLKSYQVKNMLRISPNTLQKLRMDGTIRFTKIGGILYYKYEDILKIMEGSQKSK